MVIIWTPTRHTDRTPTLKRQVIDVVSVDGRLRGLLRRGERARLQCALTAVVQSYILNPDNWLSENGGMLKILYGVRVHHMLGINVGN